jgi:hypothetical protein
MISTLWSPDPSYMASWTAADYGYGLSEPAQHLQQQAVETRQHFHEPLTYREPSIEERFRELSRLWHAETDYLSSTTALFMHPAYQGIIGMGPAVLPFLLRDLAATKSHWFWALRSISNENPVPVPDAGYVDRMTAAWLVWGIRNGYL